MGDDAPRPMLHDLLGSGARSAFIVDGDGRITMALGESPRTEIIWIPGDAQLDDGPASVISASGELLAFGRISGDFTLGAVFPAQSGRARVEQILRALDRGSTRLQ